MKDENNGFSRSTTILLKAKKPTGNFVLLCCDRNLLNLLKLALSCAV